jgi:hypothetical protein
MTSKQHQGLQLNLFVCRIVMQHHLETVGDAHSEAQVVPKSVLASSSRASVQDLKKIGS